MNYRNLSLVWLVIFVISGCAESPPHNKGKVERANNYADREDRSTYVPPRETLSGLNELQPSTTSIPQRTADSDFEDTNEWSRTYQSEGIKDVITIRMRASGKELDGTISVAEYDSPPNHTATLTGRIQGTNCVVQISDSTGLRFADGATPGLYQWRLSESGKLLSVPMINSGRDASGHDVYRAEFTLIEP